MVRPLQASGLNWKLGPDRAVIGVGHLLHCVPNGVKGSVFPHATEDTRLAAPPTLLERLEEHELYRVVLPTAKPSVRALFNRSLVEDKYIEEGADCCSLGGVAVRRRRVRFYEDFGKLRLSLNDADGTTYHLKVTCDSLQHFFSPGDTEAEPHFGVAEANEWLEVNGPDDVLVLRLGLARPWDGGERGWSPRRCYLQLNGVICPQDNYHIFAGPPITS